MNALRSMEEFESLPVQVTQTLEHEFEHIPEETSRAAIKAALIVMGIDPGIDAFEDLHEIFERALTNKQWRDKVLLREP